MVIPDLLRERTAQLHREAEETPLVQALMSGRITRDAYALFARNLLLVYETLEDNLARRANALQKAELARRDALARDVVALGAERLPTLEATEQYAARISRAAPELLVAHAYTRYLGDLSGGPLLKRSLARTLAPAELQFYDFPSIPDLRAFARQYRATLDNVARALPSPWIEAIADEAREAFRANIALVMAVEARIASQRMCLLGEEIRR